ncbi:MAG: hypothetical protein Hyperionvirus3_114 [Hyperionvirus sp.]|uniref:Uncharacterized protein n=1 Tax=Hyperionvirus sp. TaxID=2487770 RepID=A0A3G5A716_9VIRU|nr:MAG: hypothetical protein Hyperionvirus3_114 [Hyperionvirus sp.]
MLSNRILPPPPKCGYYISSDEISATQNDDVIVNHYTDNIEIDYSIFPEFYERDNLIQYNYLPNIPPQIPAIVQFSFPNIQSNTYKIVFGFDVNTNPVLATLINPLKIIYMNYIYIAPSFENIAERVNISGERFEGIKFNAYDRRISAIDIFFYRAFAQGDTAVVNITRQNPGYKEELLGPPRDTNDAGEIATFLSYPTTFGNGDILRLYNGRGDRILQLYDSVEGAREIPNIFFLGFH